MIFSTVPAALQVASNAMCPATIIQVDQPSFDSTVYLRRQPKHGFHHNDELHAYLRLRFPECGLSRGRDRPLYEVSEGALYRAKPGEVLTHRSHVRRLASPGLKAPNGR